MGVGGLCGAAPKRHAILAIASVLLLVGCATAAQRTYNRIGADIQETQVKGQQCLAVARSQPDVAPLNAKLAMGAEPSLEQLGDSSYASEAEKQALLKFSALVKPCRQIIIDEGQKDLPLTLPVFANAFSKNDQVYLG